jgi:hypothetical protein
MAKDHFRHTRCSRFDYAFMSFGHKLYHRLVGFSPEPPVIYSLPEWEEHPCPNILELTSDLEMKKADIDALSVLFADLYDKSNNAAKAVAEQATALKTLSETVAAHAVSTLTIKDVNEAIAAALDAQPGIDLTKVPGYAPTGVAPASVSVDTGAAAVG